MGSQASKCIGIDSKRAAIQQFTNPKSVSVQSVSLKENFQDQKKEILSPTLIKTEKHIDAELLRLQETLSTFQEEQYLLIEARIDTFPNVQNPAPANSGQTPDEDTPNWHYHRNLLNPLFDELSCQDIALKYLIQQLFSACEHGNLQLVQSYFASPKFEGQHLSNLFSIRSICKIRYPCENPLLKNDQYNGMETAKSAPHKPRAVMNGSEKECLRLRTLQILELTLLQYCVILNQYQVLNYLLSLTDDYDPNGINPLYGYNALHLSVLFDRLQALELLCNQPRVNIHERGSDGKNALLIAIELRHFHAVECIIRLKPNYDIKQRDFEGNSVLHLLAMNPDEKILQLILKFIEAKYFSNHQSHSSSDLEFMDPNYLLRKKKLIYELRNHHGETAFTILNRKLLGLKEEFLDASNDERNCLESCLERLITVSNYPFNFQETITSFGYNSENSSPSSTIHKGLNNPPFAPRYTSDDIFSVSSIAISKEDGSSLRVKESTQPF